MKNAIYKLVILFVLQYNYIIKGTQTMDSTEFSYKSMGTWLCLECTVVKTILTTTKLISVDIGVLPNSEYLNKDITERLALIDN
jgi:hypothetical protein